MNRISGIIIIFVSLLLRYVFVNFRVNLIRILYKPPLESRANITRIFLKRRRRTEVRRVPVKASKRRNKM